MTEPKEPRPKRFPEELAEPGYRMICVFSSSSDVIAPHFFRAAEELAAWIASRKCALMFGGGNIGLMGRMAEVAHANGGKVVGVIPEMLHLKGYAYEKCDELIVTPTMRERKFEMEERADAFVALPGGFGTLEELLEVITLKQLKYHDKPVALLNLGGFFDGLLKFFDHLYEQGFAKPKHRAIYHAARDLPELIEYLDEYRPPIIPEKRS